VKLTLVDFKGMVGTTMPGSSAPDPLAADRFIGS
jgi:hypothetical protein